MASGGDKHMEDSGEGEEVEIFSTDLNSTFFLFSFPFSQGGEWCTWEDGKTHLP